MANVPYNPVADVTPDARAPDDYQRVQSSPADFGGLIAQGTEQLGKGISAAAAHWGEIQVDSLTNDYQRRANDIVENFKKLRGADALQAQDSTKQQLYDLYDKTKNQLSTSDQTINFDRINRPFTDRNLIGTLNTYSNEQALQFGKQTNNDGIYNANSQAANAGSNGNEAVAVVQYHRAIEFENKQLKLDGQENDPQARQSAIQRAGLTIKSYLESLAVNQPQKAYADADRFKNELGPLWAPLKDQLKERADKQIALGAVQESERAVASGYRQGSATQPAALSVGDSTADGVRLAGGLAGDTLVGRPSRAVATSISNLPQASAPGTPLIIGTGVMNDAGPSADLKRVDFAVVSNQIDAAKAKGYSPVILGVGGKYAALNPELQKIAEQKGAKFAPLGPNDGTHASDGYKTALSNAIGNVGSANIAGGNVSQNTSLQTGRVSNDQLYNVFHNQESGGGANISTSVDNAHGDMQIIPDTFKRFALPGERIDNKEDNIRVGKRILTYYDQKYNGDVARIAVAYFSGEGNVAPVGNATPWKENRHDGQGTYVSQYVNGILKRLKQPSLNAPAPPPIGHGSLTASGVIARPGWQNSSGPDVEPKQESSSDLPIVNAAVTSPVPAPQPQSAEQTPEDLLATQVNWLETNPNLSDNQKRMAIQEAKANYQTKLIEYEQNAQAKKTIKDRIANEYQGYINKGNAQAYKQLVNDPRLNDDEPLRATLMERFQRTGTTENTLSFGDGYNQMRERMLLPPSDPNHIGSIRQIMQATNDGLIKEKGEEKLIKMYNELGAHKTTYGFQTRVTGTLEKAKRYFSFDNPFIKIKNDKGQNIYDQKFLNSFYDQLDEWLADGKNDPNKFPLFDEKNLDKEMQTLWPKREKNQYYLNAAGEQIGAKPDLPPAPEGSNEVYWNTLMSSPPMKAGAPIDTGKWSAFVGDLIKNKDDPEYAKRWDKFMINTDIRAKDLLDRLGIKNALPEPERPQPQVSPNFDFTP